MPRSSHRRPPLPRQPARSLASELHALLDRNVDDHYDGRTSRAELVRRQREVWQRINRAGVADQVLDRVRAELPPDLPARTQVGRPGQVSRARVEREVRAVAGGARGR